MFLQLSCLDHASTPPPVITDVVVSSSLGKSEAHSGVTSLSGIHFGEVNDFDIGGDTFSSDGVGQFGRGKLYEG